MIKHSRQREAILADLRSRRDHPTADMVYESVRIIYPNISLGTIYRNLSLLVEIGEIQKITTDGADRFDARVTPHNHFICRRCGRVMDMMVPVDSPVIEANKLWDGGEIHECRMEFYGICKDCKKTEN